MRQPIAIALVLALLAVTPGWAQKKDSRKNDRKGDAPRNNDPPKARVLAPPDFRGADTAPRGLNAKELERQLAKARQELEKAIKKYGEDSREARTRRQQLQQFEMMLKYYKRGTRDREPGSAVAPPLPPPPRGFGTPPSSRFGSPGATPADQAEQGQRMVIAGLQVQLRALAAQIRKARDRDDQKELMQEFREVAGQIVSANKRLLGRRIRRLEKQLSDLKKEAKESQSVEALEKRYLGREDDAGESGTRRRGDSPRERRSDN